MKLRNSPQATRHAFFKKWGSLLFEDANDHQVHVRRLHAHPQRRRQQEVVDESADDHAGDPAAGGVVDAEEEDDVEAEEGEAEV